MNQDDFVSLEINKPIWERAFVVAPLVVVGTREGDSYDLAPKHMASPMSWDNFFGFVCTPERSTYHNAKRANCFTVSYPRADQVTMASLTATPRQGGAEGNQPVLDQRPSQMRHSLQAL